METMGWLFWKLAWGAAYLTAGGISLCAGLILVSTALFKRRHRLALQSSLQKVTARHSPPSAEKLLSIPVRIFAAPCLPKFSALCFDHRLALRFVDWTGLCGAQSSASLTHVLSGGAPLSHTRILFVRSLSAYFVPRLSLCCRSLRSLVWLHAAQMDDYGMRANDVANVLWLLEASKLPAKIASVSISTAHAPLLAETITRVSAFPSIKKLTWGFEEADETVVPTEIPRLFCPAIRGLTNLTSLTLNRIRSPGIWADVLQCVSGS